jgi:predicted transcriptional regulator
VFFLAKYRGRLEIIVDVLNVASKGAKKTRIMYIANLSHKLLEKYLEESVKLGFIYFSNDSYEVTEKGRTFLEKYNDFSSRYSKVGVEFQRMQFEREDMERLCTPMRNAARRVATGRRHKR